MKRRDPLDNRPFHYLSWGEILLALLVGGFVFLITYDWNVAVDCVVVP